MHEKLKKVDLKKADYNFKDKDGKDIIGYNYAIVSNVNGVVVEIKLRVDKDAKTLLDMIYNS